MRDIRLLYLFYTGNTSFKRPQAYKTRRSLFFRSDRTPQGIAVEINRIKQQTCKIMLSNAIEIGKRLKEAKALALPWRMGKMAGGISELFPAHSQKAGAAL